MNRYSLSRSEEGEEGDCLKKTKETREEKMKCYTNVVTVVANKI